MKFCLFLFFMVSIFVFGVDIGVKLEKKDNGK